MIHPVMPALESRGHFCIYILSGPADQELDIIEPLAAEERIPVLREIQRLRAS
jgi:hypothetical protein